MGTKSGPYGLYALGNTFAILQETDGCKPKRQANLEKPTQFGISPETQGYEVRIVSNCVVK